MTSQNRPYFVARLSHMFGVATIAAAILGPLLARFGVVAPLRGFLLFASALPLALLAILLGAFGVFSTRRSTGRIGARSSWFAVLSGLLVLVILSALGRSAGDAPRIHDITTDLDDPPIFLALAEVPGNAGEDLTYPHGDERTPELHSLAYPNLATMHLQKTPEATVALIETIATNLGWTLISTNGPTPTESVAPTGAEPGSEASAMPSKTTSPSPPQVEATVEATASSGIFRFVDDIVVRVRGPMSPNDARSTVDIRSKSRDGQSDLGVNAERIRAFQAALQDTPRG